MEQYIMTVWKRALRPCAIVGVIGLLGQADSVEASVLPGSVVGHVVLNAGPGIDASGQGNDCHDYEFTLGRGELRVESPGGINGRRISAYIFRTPDHPVLSVKVVARNQFGEPMPSCAALDSTKNAQWVHRYSPSQVDCTGAMDATVTCYNTTTGH